MDVINRRTTACPLSLFDTLTAKLLLPHQGTGPLNLGLMLQYLENLQSAN